jgi:hypothetical protein
MPCWRQRQKRLAPSSRSHARPTDPARTAGAGQPHHRLPHPAVVVVGSTSRRALGWQQGVPGLPIGVGQLGSGSGRGPDEPSSLEPPSLTLRTRPRRQWCSRRSAAMRSGTSRLRVNLAQSPSARHRAGLLNTWLSSSCRSKWPICCGNGPSPTCRPGLSRRHGRLELPAFAATRGREGPRGEGRATPSRHGLPVPSPRTPAAPRDPDPADLLAAGFLVEPTEGCPYRDRSPDSLD